MDDDQQFCLRWNNHQSTLISVFDTLLENETLVDCTLAAEGKFLKAHKVVLSACSPYFATLLQEQYDKHPIFILKDVKYQELRAMMDYMYRGEVNISQDQLAALLKAAESLQIKGLSDNRTGGGAAPKPESSGQQQHHRGGKLSGAYTLEQTKRARLATGGAMDTSGDVSGSREGSSSPSRRRRKVRRRSMENDAHDNSNSSVLQAAASNQSILQQTGAGLAVSALVSTQLASGPAAGTSSSQASSTQQQQQPLTSTNVTKKTESAKLTSSTAAPASGASASAAAVQQAHLQQQHQQAQTTSDAINTENVQAQSQGGAQGVQGDDEDMDEGSAIGGASAASGPNPASASASAVHAGVVVKQLASVVDKSSSNHKQKIKDNSVSSVGSEMVIEPKAEYDDDAHDENVEDLTLDEEDMTMEELDQTAGTSQGGEGSSQTYATWQHDRSQDELGILGQDAQQRDPQDLSITRIAGLTWNEWNARLAMPLVTLREGAQPLVFPTDLSVDKQQAAAAGGLTAKDSLSSSGRKTPTDVACKSEPRAASTPARIHSSSNHSSNGKPTKTSSGGKLKHLSEEEATALMLKAVAEKQAAAAAGTELSFGEDQGSSGNGGNSSDYPATLSGAVTFADVGGPAGLCHINILNSISAMNNLISGSTAAGVGMSTGSVSGSGSGQSPSNNSGGGGNSMLGGADNGAGHPCPVCGRVYKLKSSLRNHQKWECGKEPQFQCPFCVYRAKQKMHIGRHMERMHKEKFKLEDVKSYAGSGGLDGDSSGATAAALSVAAAASALASGVELHPHFS
ncbi:longitudinals lacking protein, isoforms A/B/D/L isoform X4 [Drosophila subpulchrella]|uniref:longitudinals lacking protein, isoforms A/B/D/L isoform X4 n=1 Tax=Drosophila subpulchrella TaxID=1486046 RepID=UPI0018A12DD9|nr:longitudinals lacking protein, isoforms A/B/D/L isoform X4 [Drosophila subpulchrella]